MRRSHVSMLLAVFSVSLVGGGCSAPLVHDAVTSPTRKSIWMEETDDVLVLRYGEERLAEVHYRATPVPYLWPVFADGEIPVTRSFPMADVEGEAKDHPHHVSLWMTHGDVNGVDFWHAGAKRPGTIEYTGRLLEKFPRVKRFLLGLEYAWKDPDGETLLMERRRIEFAVEEPTRWMDFEIRLTAVAGDVTFGDTKEGSFAIRTHPELRLRGDVATGEAVNSEGVEGKDVWGKRAKWVHYQGTIGGEEVGIVMFDHPANLRHPTWWHARDYGLVAANPFGIHDFEGEPAGTGNHVLAKGESLTQRYRVLIHRGKRTREEVAKLFEVYRLHVPVNR